MVRDDDGGVRVVDTHKNIDLRDRFNPCDRAAQRRVRDQVRAPREGLLGLTLGAKSRVQVNSHECFSTPVPNRSFHRQRIKHDSPSSVNLRLSGECVGQRRDIRVRRTLTHPKPAADQIGRTHRIHNVSECTWEPGTVVGRSEF